MPMMMVVMKDSKSSSLAWRERERNQSNPKNLDRDGDGTKVHKKLSNAGTITLSCIRRYG
jgi:hypothetical protein